MTVIERLNAKKNELEERLAGQSQWGSQRRETLQYKIKKIEELIATYEAPFLSADLSEAEQVLSQQVGFTEQKEKILNNLKIAGYCERNSIKKKPLVLCLIGPPGVGKTSFARLLSQALKKEFFMVALGGISDSSLLLGTNESSSGTELGQLTKALTETKTCDPLILLDEIDKVNSYKGNSAIHSCLNAVLDPVQNKEILDYYLDVKLDFSHATFIITVNNENEIPGYLSSRMPTIVKLLGYNLEQKKEIANTFIRKWFNRNSSLNQNNFEITPEALEVLINKTREKGVRQLLEKVFEDIFDYCLLQWAQEANQGEPESKITIDSDLVHKIIPHDFTNIDLDDQENNPENKNEKRELESLRRELAFLRGEKNNQTELKSVRFNSLLVLRQIRGQFTEKEYQSYEGRINIATTREEIEIAVKEFLLKTKQKSISSKPIKENQSKEIQDELAKIKGQNKTLEDKIKIFNDEIKKLKGKKKDFPERGNNDKILLVAVIIILVIWGVYGILKILNFLRKHNNATREREREQFNSNVLLCQKLFQQREELNSCFNLFNFSFNAPTSSAEPAPLTQFQLLNRGWLLRKLTLPGYLGVKSSLHYFDFE